MYETFGQTRDHIPVIQTPGPGHTMQELIQTYGRGRGQARREELQRIDAGGSAHNPYRAGFKEKLRRLNT